QLCSKALESGRETLGVNLPHAIDISRACSEFGLPHSRLRGCHCSERRIPLRERPLVPSPGVHETMFHVEHSPVEQSPTACGAFFNQTMDAGIDDLDRK